MSLHEKMAARAAIEGQTPQQFKAAAQKHANATWFWGAVGAAVWYFASWKWALLPLALAAFTAVQSVSATLISIKMEKFFRPKEPGAL